MAKVLFFSAPAHGHVNPTIAVVRELVRRGESVVYYGTEEFRKKIEPTGAQFRDYQTARAPGAPPIPFGAQEIGNVFSLAALITEGTRALLPGLIVHTQNERPDYIIHDAVAMWGKIVARNLEIPAATSYSTFVFNLRSSIASARFMLETVQMFFADPAALPRCVRNLRHLRRHYGVWPQGFFDIFANRERMNVVYTAREFQPKAHTFDSTYHFVGPQIPPVETQAVDPSFPLEELAKKRVIYVAMGTIFHHLDEFYQMCFEAFEGTPWTIVLSAGAGTDISALGPIPSNFIVRNQVPQLRVLEHSSLFITHGGMNSAHEALWYAVPLVVVPQGADQFSVAHQVQRLGAGIHLNRNSLTPARIRESALAVLDDESYRRRCERLREVLRATGGYTEAADKYMALTPRVDVAKTPSQSA